jgi:hypothetical protein
VDDSCRKESHFVIERGYKNEIFKVAIILDPYAQVIIALLLLERDHIETVRSLCLGYWSNLEVIAYLIF